MGMNGRSGGGERGREVGGESERRIQGDSELQSEWKSVESLIVRLHCSSEDYSFMSSFVFFLSSQPDLPLRVAAHFGRAATG